MRSLKQRGFRIYKLHNDAIHLNIVRKRLSMDIKPFVKQIDTLAAEYSANKLFVYDVFWE